MSNEYIIDTEFIRVSKEKIHFIEVALLDVKNSCIMDYHLDTHLNGWEYKYMSRAIKGHYGKSMQATFKSIETMYSGNFNYEYANEICLQNDLEYKYIKLSNENKLKSILSDSKFFVWDQSNDKELFSRLKIEDSLLIDAQVLWQKKFQTGQISLVDAYKHTLYNMNKKDELNLIEKSHYACCDVMILHKVLDFIDSFIGELKPIPLNEEIRDEKIFKNNQTINEVKQKILRLNDELKVCNEIKECEKLSIKLIKSKKYLTYLEKENERLSNIDTYNQKWW